MDTANSLAIGWIEKLVEKVALWKRSGSIKDKEGIVERMQSLVKEMKYSYLEPAEIEDRYIRGLSALVKKLLSLPMNEDRRRFVAYLLEEVEDLPRKLGLNPSEPYQVFRYRFVTVLSVSRHPTLNLKIARVRDRHGVERTVVTNIQDVKEGDDALVVILPPRNFDGVWSEAMFVQIGASKPQEVEVAKLRSLNSYFNI